MQDIIEQLIATTKGQLARYESIKDNQAALYPLALNISTLGLFPQQYQVMGQYLRLCYQGRDWGRAARLMPFAGGHHFLNFYGETSVVLQVLSLMRTLGFPLPASFVRSEDLSAAAAPLLDVVPGLFGKAVPEAEDFIGDHFLLSDLGLPRDRAALALWQHWEQKGGGLPQPFSLPDRMWGALKAFKKVQGWGERDSFVVIHAREDGYRPEAEKHLHSRRRSVDITTYDKAINRLLAAGIRVVRLGDASMRSLTARDGLVDLCRLPRDTDVELALLAEARFMIGCASGPWTVAAGFGTPVLKTNAYPLNTRPFRSHDRFLTKKILDRRSNRLVPLSEAYAPFGTLQLEFGLNDGSTVLQDNSALEIDLATAEMMDVTEGGAAVPPPPNEDDIRLAELATDQEPFGVSARLARGFLRLNPQLC